VRDGAGRQRQAGQQRAYDVARGIHFDGAQYRRDIGHRAIKTP
jgi:phosphoribosylamine--glycine ligase